jgi:hypothetical protein
MANYLIKFQHKLPAAVKFIERTEIVFIEEYEQSLKGEDYKMMLFKKLKIKDNEIVLFDFIGRF